MTSTPRQIPVFLSYTDADYHRGVDSLKELLDASGYDAYSFRDDHPSPELNFASNVQAALQKAQFVVVIWSRNTENQQSMVLREVSIARRLRKHVILVLLDKVKKTADPVGDGRWYPSLRRRDQLGGIGSGEAGCLGGPPA